MYLDFNEGNSLLDHDLVYSQYYLSNYNQETNSRFVKLISQDNMTIDSMTFRAISLRHLLPLAYDYEADDLITMLIHTAFRFHRLLPQLPRGYFS